MYSSLKPIGFAEKLVQKYESLATRDMFLLRFIFFFTPIFVIFVLQVLILFFITILFFFFAKKLLDVNFGIKFIIISLMISILGLIYAFYVFIWIMKRDSGTDEMKEIADCILEGKNTINQIKKGSDGFFKQQYGAIIKLSIVFAILIMILYWTKDPQILGDSSSELKQSITISSTAQAIISGVSFILGALCSGFSGYAGMWVSVRANIRVTSAARHCYNEAIQIAFCGGYFGALINICLAIGGISILFLLLTCYFSLIGSSTLSIVPLFDKIPLLIISFGFGASFVAMFAQLGGGIYTKAADVGADLIGKVEAGIPEDDPRNPAVIADLVGDNVGDCAGQAADLFESISAEILSAMILGSNLTSQAQLSDSTKISFMLFPLALHCLDIVASTVGMLFVKTKKGLPEFSPNYGELEDALDVMKRGYKVAMAVGIPGLVLLAYLLLEVDGSWMYFAACGLIGVNLAFLFIELTQYYTDYHYSPVKRIVFASKSGPATNIIAGLAVGLESTGLPVLAIATSVLGSYYLGDASGIIDPITKQKIGGLYGTAIATMGMFCTGVYILSMSGYGPISDNAGGIAEMSHQPVNVRNITDRLDAIGNVTKANAKGYSVGSASLACFLLFSAFIDEVNFVNGNNSFGVINIMQPEVYIGGLLGSASVFMFSSLAIAAVGNAAQDIITEVRRQFRENPGILNNTSKPNYKHCVEIVARAGLREMIKPGLLATLSPIFCGIIFRILGNLQNNYLLGAQSVCAFLMFSTATGILMALFLNNGGGAWDNAKKYIETGRIGGKGSDIHKAAVVGDTVGDPCKDTAGPSIHILIKLLSTITLVLTPIFIGK